MLTITPATQNRIEEFEQGRHRRLLQRAQSMEMRVRFDPVSAGFAVRSHKEPGIVNIVTIRGCSCREFRIWGDCPHAVVTSEAIERAIEATAEIDEEAVPA